MEAHQVGLERQRQQRVPLDQVGGVALGVLHVDAGAVGAWVNCERQPVGGTLLVDGQVLALPERRTGAGVHHYLHQVVVAAQARDLAGGRLRVLLGDGDGTAEAAVAVVARQPSVHQPVVEGARQRRGVVGIGIHVDEGARQQDGVADAVGIDELAAQGFGIGAGTPAAGRERVLARTVQRRLVLVEGARLAAVPVLPRQWQVAPQFLGVAGVDVHVAVDDRFAGVTHRRS